MQMFKVGDKVTIKKRVFDAMKYQLNFNNQMAELAGQVCTIIRVEKCKSLNNLECVPDDGMVYYLKENGYMWTSGMLLEMNQ